MFRRNTDSHNPGRNIFDHHCACSHHRTASYGNTLLDRRTRTDMGALSDNDITTERRRRGDVHVVPDPAAVLDDRSCIDNGIGPNGRTGIGNGSGQQLNPFAKHRRGRADCCAMQNTQRQQTRIQGHFVESTPGRRVSDTTDPDDKPHFPPLPQIRKQRVIAQDRNTQQFLPVQFLVGIEHDEIKFGRLRLQSVDEHAGVASCSQNCA